MSKDPSTPPEEPIDLLVELAGLANQNPNLAKPLQRAAVHIRDLRDAIEVVRQLLLTLPPLRVSGPQKALDAYNGAWTAAHALLVPDTPRRAEVKFDERYWRDAEPNKGF